MASVKVSGDADSIQVKQLPRASHLAIVSGVLYLSLPLLLLLWAWFKPVFAVPLNLCLVFVSAWAVTSLSGAYSDRHTEKSRLGPLSYLLLLLSALLVLLVLGTGGIFHQAHGDWDKHNVWLKFLIDEPWPPLVVTDKQTFVLSYYIGWYLPAALFGKAAGWMGANLLLLVYSGFGLAALVLLSSRLTGAKLPITFLALLALAGFDPLGDLILSFLTSLPPTAQGDLEHWAVAIQFTGNISQLTHSPHIGIAGWLLTALMVAGILHDRPIQAFAFCAPLSLFWAPWLLIGLIPFGLYFSAMAVIRAIKDKRSLGELLSGPDFLACLLSVLIFAAVFLFYSTRFTVTEFDFVAPLRGYLEYATFITYFKGLKFLVISVIFLAIEIAPLVIVLWWLLRDMQSQEAKVFRQLLAVALVMLLFLPYVRGGHYNDLTMRASIPALYMLVLLAGYCVRHNPVPAKRHVLLGLLALCLASGIWTNLPSLKQNIDGSSRALFLLKPDQVLTPLCNHERKSLQVQLNFLRQYVGKREWGIHHLLLKEPAISPDEVSLRTLPGPDRGEERFAEACR